MTPKLSPLVALALGCVAVVSIKQAEASGVELALHEEDGLPFLDGSFDGVSLHCLWDSGANLSNVPDEPPFSFYPVYKTMDKGATIPRVHVNSVRLGEIELGPANIARGGPGFPTLGMDLLIARRIGIMAAPNPRLTLDSDAPESPQQLLEIKSGRYLVEISLGGRSVKALWDTGTANTRVAEDVIQTAAPRDFEVIGKYRSRRESGNRYRVRRISLGTVELGPLEVLGSENIWINGVHAILGWDVIRRLNWHFDSLHRLWSVSEPSKLL